MIVMAYHLKLVISTIVKISNSLNKSLGNFNLVINKASHVFSHQNACLICQTFHPNFEWIFLVPIIPNNFALECLILSYVSLKRNECINFNA
jgi:hypothetical protein